jgi:hypothetical protein
VKEMKEAYIRYGIFRNEKEIQIEAVATDSNMLIFPGFTIQCGDFVQLKPPAGEETLKSSEIETYTWVPT